MESYEVAENFALIPSVSQRISQLLQVHVFRPRIVIVTAFTGFSMCILVASHCVFSTITLGVYALQVAWIRFFASSSSPTSLVSPYELSWCFAVSSPL